MRKMTQFKKQKGFLMLMSIYILVVMGLALSTGVKMLTVQSATSALAVKGTRAKLAADAGLEWASYQVNSTQACPAASSSFSLSAGSLNGISVVVTCSATTFDEAGVTITNVDLVSIAEDGTYKVTPTYVQRQVSATLSF